MHGEVKLLLVPLVIGFFVLFRGNVELTFSFLLVLRLSLGSARFTTVRTRPVNMFLDARPFDLVIKRAVRIFVLPPVSLHLYNVRICIAEAFNEVTRYWSSLSSLTFGFHEPHFIPARQRTCIAGCCFSLVPLCTA